MKFKICYVDLRRGHPRLGVLEPLRSRRICRSGNVPRPRRGISTASCSSPKELTQAIPPQDAVLTLNEIVLNASPMHSITLLSPLSGVAFAKNSSLHHKNIQIQLFFKTQNTQMQGQIHLYLPTAPWTFQSISWTGELDKNAPACPLKWHVSISCRFLDFPSPIRDDTGKLMQFYQFQGLGEISKGQGGNNYLGQVFPHLSGLPDCRLSRIL